MCAIGYIIGTINDLEDKVMTNSIFLDEGMEGWTRQFIGKNLWRTKSQHDFEDLMNEAWIVFDKVSKKYADCTEKHLMALYKRALSNRIHDLAYEATRREFVDVNWSQDEEASLDNFEAPKQTTNSELLQKVAEAGEIVSKVFTAAHNGKLKPKPLRGGVRETFNERFDRVLDLPTGTNSAHQFRQFLREQT